MALIRNGHTRIYEYGYSSLLIARDELEEHKRSLLVDMAYAHRVSKATDDKWKKFIKDNTPKEATISPKEKPKKKVMTKEDHMKVIRRLKGL